MIAWTRELDGQTARKAVVHASALFTLIRGRRSRNAAFFEPIIFLLASLTLWVFVQFAQSPNSLCDDRDGGEGRLLHQATVRLDHIPNDENTKAWVENGEKMRAYLVDVGNVNSRSASNRLLAVAEEALLEMKTWALAQRFVVVLSGLKSCLQTK